jgi:hypothetical protein
MIRDQLEFHNVAEMHEVPGREGLRLQRVPEAVTRCLNETAQLKMLSPAAAEIRFRSDAETVAITLSCPEGACNVIPFWGNFQGSGMTIANETRTIVLRYPDRLLHLDPEQCKEMSFSPRVWRLLLRGAPVHYIGVEAKGLRPPEQGDVPAKRLLAYGTSITHGANATGIHLSYMSQTARRLGMDLINLGTGGSAFCEPELADYMGGRSDWDVAVLCLSVNMIAAGFPLEEFAFRTKYMIRTLACALPIRPVYCITLFPYYRDFSSAFEDDRFKASPEEYRETLRQVVRELSLPNVTLVEGSRLLQHIDGLSPDLLHPADNGMIQIAERLSRIIRNQPLD